MPQRSQKTILFDMDGTLYDSIPTILNSFRKVCLCMGEKYPGDDFIKKLIGTHLQTICGSFLSADKVEEGIAHYRRIYIASQDKGAIQLFPEVLNILTKLEQNNYTLGIVTTKSRKYSIELLEKSCILDKFKVVIGAEDVKRHKPLPDPLLKAAADLSIDPKDTFYVGDALIDMQASRAANMEFIAVTTGTTSAESFAEHNQNIVLENLENLPLSLC